MFKIGQKVVCIDGSWARPASGTKYGYGPRQHEVCVVDEIVSDGALTGIRIAKYAALTATGVQVAFDVDFFRPLESWPDLAEAAVQETLSAIPKIQPA